MKHNANNERIKRKYFTFMKEAKRQNEASIDAIAKAISRFETYNKFGDFKAFHFEQAVGFKRYLTKQKSLQTGEALSKSTIHSTLRHLKSFFQWLAMQNGYKSKVGYSDAEYFNPSEKDIRIATAQRERPIPTLEQIKHTIQFMPKETVLDQRNRALMAFILLTGARDSAVASMKLKHVDLENCCVYQDAREVHTKFSKTFTTYFFPVGDEIVEIVSDWVRQLKQQYLWGNDDPLFPKTAIAQGKNRTFEASDILQEHWSTATPIRSIFKNAFNDAGLDYFNPHSFRKTLVGLGEQLCQTPEEFKSWSQNLGHEGVLTTFLSYGNVQPKRQAEIIQNLGKPRELGKQSSIDTAALVEELFKKMQNQVSAPS